MFLYNKNLVKNKLTLWEVDQTSDFFSRKPGEDKDSTGSVTVGCDNNLELITR